MDAPWAKWQNNYKGEANDITLNFQILFYHFFGSIASHLHLLTIIFFFFFFYWIPFGLGYWTPQKRDATQNEWVDVEQMKSEERYFLAI